MGVGLGAGAGVGVGVGVGLGVGAGAGVGFGVGAGFGAGAGVGVDAGVGAGVGVGAAVGGAVAGALGVATVPVTDWPELVDDVAFAAVSEDTALDWPQAAMSPVRANRDERIKTLIGRIGILSEGLPGG